MSIATELSSDVAAAMLARHDKGSEVKRSNLKDVIVEVHDTLQRMTAEARHANRRTRAAAAPSASSTVSGKH